MKSRDAAFIVDHRRQVAHAPTTTVPSKNEEQTMKKKKSAAQHAHRNKQQQQNGNKQSPQQQQPQGTNAAPTTSASATQPPATGTTSKKTVTTSTSKKHAGKQQPQVKATKKEKQQTKNAVASAGKDTTVAPTTAQAATGASTTTAATPALSTSAKQRSNALLLDPDSLKSRNHTLFLAPSCGAASLSKSLPSWGRNRKDAAEHSVTERFGLCMKQMRAGNGESMLNGVSLYVCMHFVRLHAEILEYAQYTRSTVEDMTVHIEQMITNVRTCVQSLWPHSNVETFGSYSTGIWLPSSDVDLVILDVVEVNDSIVTVKNLRQLAKALEAQAWVHSMVLLDTAKIPVLKLVSAETRVPIDITFESSSTHSGLIARDLIKRYADELPELYPLAVVFKQLLRERDLNDAYTGGLSSYSIVLMIIHFAQLWRNGERCFQAASIYASGSLPPAPSSLPAETRFSDPKAVLESATKAGKPSSASDAGSPVKKTSAASPDVPLTPPSSYAAIVSRPKSLKRSVSETGKAETPSSESGGVQRFSYAAVAAGIAKVSEDDARSKKAASAPAAAPSSYAAAVAAAAGSKSSSSTAARTSSATKPSTSSGQAATTDAQLDSVSVTSSSADTEDSSSSCSSSSTADSDDETVKMQRFVCLGEHTMMLLEFFGIIFDYRKNGLSIRDGGYIYRLADLGSDIGKPALVIEDPIHPDRNVSASSFAFSKVVAVFEDSYYALKYHRPTKFTPSALSCLLSSSGHTSHATKGILSR